MTTDTAWMDWAICADTDPDLFFAEPSDPVTSRVAKRICSGCPVVAECLAWALDRDETGVWGGTTESERRGMKRRSGSGAGLDLAA